MALTAQHDRTVRIAAPLPFVWNEVSDLGQLPAYFREVRSYEVAADGRRAQVLIEPYQLDVSGELRVTEFSPLTSVSFRFNAPRLQLDYHGTFQLTADGDAATSLRYSARMVCHYPGVQWRRQEASTRMRKHVIDLTERIRSFNETHPVVRNQRQRLTAAIPGAPPSCERNRRDSRDGVQACGSTAGHRTTAPVVRAHRDPPWLDAAQARLQGRLRRLIEESDPDERRTPAWATLDQLHRSLRYPFAKPPA